VLAVLTGRLDLHDHDTQMLVLLPINQAAPGNQESCTRLIRYLAPPTARSALEKLVKLNLPRDDFIDGLIEEGLARRLAQRMGQDRAEGEARMRLRILTARGFTIPDDIRVKVLDCTDTDQLEARGDRAATAASLTDVFTG
jgi:hypothetical protein